MIKKITIPLQGISALVELFAKFAQILHFPSYFGNNWDALYDTLNSITTESGISADPTLGPGDHIHLIFQHVSHLETTFSSGELDRFYMLLIDISRIPMDRGGDVTYTFEIRSEQ